LIHQNKMSLRFNVSSVQEKTESFFSRNLRKDFNEIKGSTIKSYPLDNSFVNDIKSIKNIDVQNLYFNGILSIVEALKGINKGFYSWSTVKLYYSSFYLLKCSLISNDIIIFRQGRDVYYAILEVGEFVKKIPSDNKTDHQSSIWLFNEIYANSDLLLSNTINDINPLTWLRNKREEINYKHDVFQEPDPPYFWLDIDQMISEKNLSKVVSQFINDDSYLYTFQEEYAILAVPLVRLALTYKDLQENNYQLSFDDKQLVFLKRFVNQLKLGQDIQKYLE
jgi:hypothetical protein